MADAGDPGAVDDDALVLEDRCACAIDDANVLEDFYRRVLAVKIFGTDGDWRGSLCECNRERKSEGKKQNKKLPHDLAHSKRRVD